MNAVAVSMLAGGLLAGVTALGPTGPPDADLAAPGPFGDAVYAPADVTLLVHAESAAALRAGIADRPIARVITSVMEGGELARAWGRLAARSGQRDAMLFDLCFGRRFSLFLRRDEDGPTDWALLTEVDPPQIRTTFDRLLPRRLAPRMGCGMAELPEYELIVARKGSRVLVGPASPRRLFEEILPRFAADTPADLPEPGLAAHPALRKVRRLGGEHLAMFVRHEPPLGGWSVLTADVRGERVMLKHRGRYDTPPFNRAIPKTGWDRAPLAALRDAGLMAVAEPRDVGETSLELMAELALGAPLLPMHPKLGDCRIFTIGEVEGRMEPHGADLLVPTGAVTIPLRGDVPADAAAKEILDRHMMQLVRRAPRLHEAWSLARAPTLEALRAGAPRQVDLAPVMQRLGMDLPVWKSLELSWDVARGPTSSYYVIATHPQHLAQTVKALETAPIRPPQMGRWASCGTLNGRRVGMHLRTYADQAALLAAGDDDAREAFRATMLILSQLADGVDRCDWRLRRPDSCAVCLDIAITLSPPESADERREQGGGAERPRD